MKKNLNQFKIKIKNLIGTFEMENSNKNYFKNSKIIIKSDINFIKNKLFEKKLKKTRLLYRGSENNFCANKFREFCLNKGPTMTIIKSEKNKIIGGYIKKTLER